MIYRLVRPLLAKVGPDLDQQQLRDIAEVALATGIDGLIVGNTTVDGQGCPSAPITGEPGSVIVLRQDAMVRR